MVSVFTVLAHVTSIEGPLIAFGHKILAIGAHGEILIKEGYSDNLHFFSFDIDSYRKPWTKPVPSTVSGLYNMVISHDGNLNLISEDRSNVYVIHEFSQDFQHVSSSDGCLIACLESGRKAFLKVVDER